jgi:hypothetical protein
MIKRFRKVNDELYRGGAPSIKDIIFLKKKLGINKIISLDSKSGKKIDRATSLLKIKHIMLPIEFGDKSSLIKFLKQDINKLYSDGPVFIHCAQGKDRTGLAIAIYRCEHDSWNCEEALKEAKQLGYGLGVPEKVLNIYNRIIKNICGCKDTHDTNFAYDIVSNEREDDHVGGSSTQLSWSPYEDYRVKEFPYSKQEIDWPEQYESRQDFGLEDSIDKNDSNKGIPQSGGWDTSTNGIMGSGPSLIGSGYI